MKISQRGQITIPKHLRERFGLKHNVEVEISPTVDGILIRKGRAEKTSPEPVVLINRTRVKSDEEAKRLASYFNRTGEPIDPDHPVNRVAGILDGTDFDIDEYIEEIRGR